MDKDNYQKKHVKCKFFFLLNVLLEAVAIVAVVYCTLFSNCVLGNEVGGAAFIFLLFIFSAFIPDLFYLMLSPKLHTLGIDPLGVMFNFIIAGLCVLIGISLIIMVLLWYCGSYAQFILVMAGALSVCSGVFHLMNALMGNQLPKSERYYRQSHRLKAPKAPKEPKKPKEPKVSREPKAPKEPKVPKEPKAPKEPTTQKDVTKSAQKDVKKGDAKVDKKNVEKDVRKDKKKDERKVAKKSGQTRKQMVHDANLPKGVPWVLIVIYFMCGAMELAGFLCLLLYLSSICLLGRENSTRIWFSMNCIFPQIVPDLVFAVSGFRFVTPFYAPVVGVYNIVVASLCILSGILAFASFTGCGNPAQPLVFPAGSIGLIAGGLHILIIKLVIKKLG
ncbi:uncharacterized protein LOC128857469 [Anastrepha ludens]|uniref:uncharacterized protein LOC128857469 n=1 Tax=Anastrepha ludens TaxID=28586 RepID=UPI0023AF99EA|nr:uncharacterized protein LOC128857469 [Anastrepha ludens]